MELVIPTEDTGYSGMFLVGYRKASSGQTERTGTVLLKRSYTIDPASGTLSFVIPPLPIFMSDLPHNLVQNGDFEADLETDPQPWQTENAVITRVVDPDIADNHLLRIQGPPGDRVFQEIAFGERLGGNDMTLVLSARSDGAAGQIEVCLEAEHEPQPGVVELVTICQELLDLTAEPNACSVSDTWPDVLDADRFRVMLKLAGAMNGPVYLDNVLVFATRYYEHDLSSYKPLVDIVVPGFVPPPTDAPVMAAVWVRQHGADQVWLQRDVGPSDRQHLFGWAPRAGGPRKAQGGTFPDDPDAYPLADPLPEDFDNLYFNGYRRDPDATPGATLAPDAEITIMRDGNVDYRFSLPGDTAEATLACYNGSGPDRPEQWQEIDVAMRLDTLVVEPEAHCCYLVWRGVWPFDDYADDSYRRLTVHV